MSQTIELIKEVIMEVLEENGLEGVSMDAYTNLLNQTPLDSLGLALVILKLEDRTQKDPFSQGFINFQTIGELAALYDA